MAKYRCARRTATQRGLLRSSRDLHIYKTTFRDLQIWVLLPLLPGGKCKIKRYIDSSERACQQRLGDLRGRQLADAAQQPSAIINRRMPDKTRTRQPAPDHCGLATGENGRHLPATPPRGEVAPIWTPCAGHTTRSRPASPPTVWCTQPRPTPRSSDVAR